MLDAKSTSWFAGGALVCAAVCLCACTALFVWFKAQVLGRPYDEAARFWTDSNDDDEVVVVRQGTGATARARPGTVYFVIDSDGRVKEVISKGVVVHGGVVATYS